MNQIAKAIARWIERADTGNITTVVWVATMCAIMLSAVASAVVRG